MNVLHPLPPPYPSCGVVSGRVFFCGALGALRWVCMFECLFVALLHEKKPSARFFFFFHGNCKLEHGFGSGLVTHDSLLIRSS